MEPSRCVRTRVPVGPWRWLDGEDELDRPPESLGPPSKPHHLAQKRFSFCGLDPQHCAQRVIARDPPFGQDVQVAVGALPHVPEPLTNLRE